MPLHLEALHGQDAPHVDLKPLIFVLLALLWAPALFAIQNGVVRCIGLVCAGGREANLGQSLDHHVAARNVLHDGRLFGLASASWSCWPHAGPHGEVSRFPVEVFFSSVGLIQLTMEVLV